LVYFKTPSCYNYATHGGWDFTWLNGKKVYCWKHTGTVNLDALDKIVLHGS
jgi:hypothetical protein